MDAPRVSEGSVNTMTKETQKRVRAVYAQAHPTIQLMLSGKERSIMEVAEQHYKIPQAAIVNVVIRRWCQNSLEFERLFLGGPSPAYQPARGEHDE